MFHVKQPPGNPGLLYRVGGGSMTSPMMVHFAPFFKSYEALLILADETFNRVQNDYPGLVKCRITCDDCCYALFDLTLIEAIHINHRFRHTFKDRDLEERLESANRIDRKIHQIKRNAYKKLTAGEKEDRILREMAGIRIRCPLLNESQQCDLYDHRPVTCRLYGIPTAINGVGYTCGKSGFVKGRPYPTVNLDPIHKQLFHISAGLIRAINARHVKLAESLVPLSMALLTDYDRTYLGIDGQTRDNAQPKG